MSAVPEHILVFVPGYMGSTLRDPVTGDDVWLNFSSLPIEPWLWGNWLDAFCKRMAYPSPLVPSGVLDDVMIISPFVKQEQYGRLFIELKDMGYVTDGDEAKRNVYPFAYDWRQDNRLSAKQLGDAIARWRAFHPNAQVWIIAHSNGGVVARWYVEKQDGNKSVSRIFLMGSPYDGTPLVMRIAFTGVSMLGRPGFDLFGVAEKTRAMFRTFPSLYQLMPIKKNFLENTEKVQIDPFEAEGAGWLDDPTQRAYLRDGQRFTQELGDADSVETLCFFGRNRPTVTTGLVSLATEGTWGAITWDQTNSGDGTIPEQSAAHPNAKELLPFAVSHGDIYVNPSVLEKLRWELIDKFATGLDRSLVATESMQLSFNPDKDGYGENETIWLSAEVGDSTGASLANAVVAVTLRWDRPLPGDVAPELVPNALTVKLVPLARKPGRFEGLLFGPATNGIYRLIARATHTDLGEVVDEEIIAVETRQ